MSANDVIYIDRSNFKVYYQGCADNNDKGNLIGKGKTLDEAIDIAQKYLGDGYTPEYGINFIGKTKSPKLHDNPLDYEKVTDVSKYM
jgi:hypothetical protein